MKQKMDLRGHVYGLLTVTSLDEARCAEGKGTYWNVKCHCGTETSMFIGNLRTRKAYSCGCVPAKPTHSVDCKHRQYVGTRTYRIWSNMISRCTNKNVKAYKGYGGRGITVCERWFEFDNFLADMGDCPKK